MTALALHEFHAGLGARFAELSGGETVNDYGDVLAEHAAMNATVGALDLGFRGRICITGADRLRFLNGQVTNNVKDLQPGQGCYAALVTAKGKMQSDLNIYCLNDELLLDFEPGLTEAIAQRLEKYVIADDVQVADVSALYGLLSVQGSRAEAAVKSLALTPEIPVKPMSFAHIKDETLGEIYLMNLSRAGKGGIDLFVPTASLGAVMDKLIAAAKSVGGRACGWQALEMARIEAGIPRFGQDMDESNLASECLGENAISYSKGCYIGQEVIARVKSRGQVSKSLRGLQLADGLKGLPAKGDKLFHDSKEAGYVTSALASTSLKANIALGYVRREVNEIGTELVLRSADGETAAKVVRLPFAQ